MPNKPTTFRPHRSAPKTKVFRPKNTIRGSANERGYNYQWQKATARMHNGKPNTNSYLYRNPLCVACEANGHVTTATVVDHIKPHRGDIKLFWDKDNWQPMCKRCHDLKTRRGE